MKTKIFILLFAVVANIGVASAAITVRLNTQNCSNWATVYLWAQTSDGEVLFSSPGAEVNQDVEGWYSYTFKENVSEVNIIWRGNSGNYSLSSNEIYYVKESTDYILNDCGTYYEPNASVNIVGLPANVVTGLFQLGDLYYKIDGKMAEVTSHIEGWDNYRGLEYVSIPSSVSYNGVNYPVKQIDEYAFSTSYELKSITIPNSVTCIGDYAFEACDSLNSINIPNSVTSIGWAAFYGCRSLPTITIPNSVTSIGGAAFSGCTALTSVTIPNSIDSINDGVFEWCTNLTSVSLPDNLTYIGVGAFRACGLSSIHIPNNVTYIGASAFEGCSNLKDFQIPNGVTHIRAMTFLGWGIKSLTIPAQVDSIDEEAFAYCDSLKSVFWNAKKATTPSSLYSYYPVFLNCPIETVTIGEDVDSLPGVFYGITSLKNVIWNAKNCNVAALGHSGVGAIFSEDLEQITFGNKVEYIPNQLCEGTKIKSVVLPNSVKAVGTEAFSYCSYLTSVIIGDGLETLEFSNNTTLGVFSQSHPTSVTCYATTPPIIHELFNYGFGATIYVPESCVDAYKSADCWKEHWTILPIGATPVETDAIHITPSEYYADIVWKAIANAATYELVIEFMGNTWRFIFDAEGILISSAQHAPSRYDSPQVTQSAGFSYTVIGLASGTTYNVTITAKAANGNTLKTETASFTTTGEPQGLEVVNASNTQSKKIIHDGNVYILRGDKVFTLQGQEVK